MKKLFSVLLGVLIAYGALKIYLYYDVKNTLEILIAKSKPFAQIKYDHFSTSPFEGKITLSNVQINAIGSNDGLNIQHLTVKGLEFYPSPQHSIFLFDFSKRSIKQLKLEGISNKSNSGYISKLIQNYVINFVPQDSLSDVTINLMPQANHKHMQVDYTQTNRDMFTLHLNLLVDLPTTQAYKSMHVYEGTLTYQDHSLFKKWLAESTKTQQQLVEDLKMKLENQITLSPADLGAIKKFIAHPNTVSIHIRPYEPLDLDIINKLRLYQPDDIPKILNLSITSE